MLASSRDLGLNSAPFGYINKAVSNSFAPVYCTDRMEPDVVDLMPGVRPEGYKKALRQIGTSLWMFDEHDCRGCAASLCDVCHKVAESYAHKLQNMAATHYGETPRDYETRDLQCEKPSDRSKRGVRDIGLSIRRLSFVCANCHGMLLCRPCHQRLEDSIDRLYAICKWTFQGGAFSVLKTVLYSPNKQTLRLYMLFFSLIKKWSFVAV